MAFLPLIVALGAFAPAVPDPPPPPHPVTLRRERLNRQASHARGRKGHR